MKQGLLALIITATVATLMTGCLELSDPKSASNQAASTQTQLFAYYLVGDNKMGCYGNPDDTTLAGKVVTVTYTMAMEDANTLLICVAIPSTNGGTIPVSSLASKTINFYASNTASNPGAVMDLTAIRIPVADVTTTAFYVTGTSTPCPDGTATKLVGRLDLTDYLPLKYIQIYDECGTCAGTAVSPTEVQRQIDAGFVSK
ncbi:MAG: hypothetical protein WCQ53_01500 [bacterium]